MAWVQAIFLQPERLAQRRGEFGGFFESFSKKVTSLPRPMQQFVKWGIIA